jgi:hypothetical protein
MSRTTTMFVLLLAAILEAGGDALVPGRQALCPTRSPKKADPLSFSVSTPASQSWSRRGRACHCRERPPGRL